MSLLSGLSSMGLGKLEEADLYSEQKSGGGAKPGQARAEKPFDENEVLFDKGAECPVCDKRFSYRAVKTGKARPAGQDQDLRPKYEKFDPLKYDVIVCPHCGYAALSKYHGRLPSAQVKLVKEGIFGKVYGLENNPIFTYDDAIRRYKLAIACCIVKKARDSEKAYCCLKLGWVIRGKKETLPKDIADYEDEIGKLVKDENEALRMAFEGFVNARQKENFPIAGMDETTLDYLLAVLAARFERFDVAQKLIAGILLSRTANNRIKDRARDLKDQVLEQMKTKGEFS